MLQTYLSPQRVTSKGPVDIAASGFSAIWKASPFYCPHTTSRGQKFKPLKLKLRAPLNGEGVADFYAAIDHVCAFKSKPSSPHHLRRPLLTSTVVVKPLKERNVLLTWDDRARYQCACTFIFEDAPRSLTLLKVPSRSLRRRTTKTKTKISLVHQIAKHHPLRPPTHHSHCLQSPNPR